MTLSRPQSHAARLVGPALILLAAFVAITPLLIRGNACGHDFDYHLVSWIDALHSWHQGILYPRWASSPLFGAGEPRFVFYPPLTWMTGAALGAVLPWRFVPTLIVWLILAATGLATRALAREAMDEAPSILAGCAAMFFGYALFVGYTRSAFPEMTGGFWVPMLLLFILRDRNPSAPVLKRALDGSAALLALVVAGAWLSNAPVGVMINYLLVAVALLVALLSRSWAPVIRAAVSVSLGMALAAIYLIPAGWEQHWVGISRVIDDFGYGIQSNWLFTIHTNPNYEFDDWVNLQVSLIAVAMVGITFVSLLVSWLRGRLPGKRRWWIPLAAIPFVVLLLQLPFSLPIWKLLPELKFLQFPWRWLEVVEAPMAVLFASAVWTNRRRWRWVVAAACAGLFLLNTYGAWRFMWSPCHQDTSVATIKRHYRTGAIMNDSDQYAPPSANDALVAMHLPDACFTTHPFTALGHRFPDGTFVWIPDHNNCAATFRAQAIPGKPRIEHFRIAGVTDSSGYLILRLRTYPAWRVRVNGRLITALPKRKDGLMAVPVPKGPVNVTVNWTATPDVLIGRWVSALAVLLLTVLWLFERKHSLPRL